MTEAKSCARLTNLRIALLGSCALLISLGGTACHGGDDRPPAWEYLSPAIFQPNCATSSCHSRAAAVAGLDFSDPDRGYTSLTGLWVWIVDPQGTADQGCKPLNGSVVCQRPHRPMVTPFDPAQSRLVNMLRAQAAPRMPPDRPLPEADIRLVERWILNGATKTLGGAAAGVVDAATDAPADGVAPAGDAAAADGRPGDSAGSDGGTDATADQTPAAAADGGAVDQAARS